MKTFFATYEGNGQAVQTVARELARRAPPRFEIIPAWRQCELTIDLLVDSPLGSLANRSRAADRPHWDWHYELLQRITGPQQRALFFVCCFEGSDLLRYAARTAAISFSFLPDFPARLGESRIRWSLQPLGVDPAAFESALSDREREDDAEAAVRWYERAHDIYTWGYVDGTEMIDVISRACAQSGRYMLHSGLDFQYAGAHYHFCDPAGEAGAVARRYALCRYANAMREPYGFELAAIEAPLAGCRPLCLALPCYAHWFRDLPTYIIPQADRGAMAEAVARALAQDRPVTSEERAWVRETFNWDRVAAQFWRSLEDAL